MTLTPEQLKALQESLTPSVKIATTLGLAIEAVESFQKLARLFVSKHYKQFAGKPFYLVFSEPSSGSSDLTLKVAKDAVYKGNGLLYVDKQFHLVKTDKIPSAKSDFSSLLFEQSQFGVAVAESYIEEILCGFLIDEIDVVTNKRESPFSGKIKSRPMENFDLLLSDHVEHCVDGQKNIEYWADKKERILLTGPHGTEWIFQKSLYWWLDNYVSEHIGVIAEPSGFGQHKHDIKVITQNGTYVIEVKWLGTNGKTVYRRKRINEGLEQVKIYLEGDAGLLCGHLVAYDGRSPSDHEKKSSYDVKFQHELCEKPHIIFLKSETPSKEAERVVRETK